MNKYKPKNFDDFLLLFVVLKEERRIQKRERERCTDFLQTLLQYAIVTYHIIILQASGVLRECEWLLLFCVLFVFLFVFLLLNPLELELENEFSLFGFSFFPSLVNCASFFRRVQMCMFMNLLENLIQWKKKFMAPKLKF